MLHQFDLIAPRKVVSFKKDEPKRPGTARSRKKVVHVATASKLPASILGNRRLSEVLDSKIHREAKQ